jgi:hypothetical protein
MTFEFDIVVKPIVAAAAAVATATDRSMTLKTWQLLVVTTCDVHDDVT